MRIQPFKIQNFSGANPYRKGYIDYAKSSVLSYSEKAISLFNNNNTAEQRLRLNLRILQEFISK